MPRKVKKVPPIRRRRGVPMMRTSECLSFKTCEQQWHWSFNDRLEPTTDRPALRFGDLWHRSLERYYKPGRKRGPHPAQTFEKLYHADLRDELDRLRIKTPDNDWLDALDLGVGMFEAYVEQYKDQDAEFEVLMSEQTFQVPIRDPETKKLLAYYVGTIDGIWRKLSNGRLYFKEHKTTGSSVPQVLEALPMDEQAGRYWAFGPWWCRKYGFLLPGEKLEGILYTISRKAIRNPDWDYDDQGRKLNQDGSISKQQPGQFFGRQPIFRDRADREIMRVRVVEEAKRMAELREHPERIIKNPGKLFMPNCRFCEFRDMCELHETGNDWEAMRDGTMTTWDPYAAHEIKAGDRT